MNTFMEKLKALSKKLFLPWVAVYLVIAGGAAVWAADMYEEYKDYRLPSGKIELTVGKTKYQLGETVTFSVTNNFSVPIFVTNNCPQEPLDVYEWTGTKWTALHDRAKDNSECYSEERNVEIPAGGVRGYDFEDWPNLFTKPGVYRIATKIDHYDDILFQDFAILEPAKILEVKTPAAPVKIETTAQPLAPETQIYTEEEYEDDKDEYREHEDEYEREEEDD